jgi:hypothetical protein
MMIKSEIGVFGGEIPQCLFSGYEIIENNVPLRQITCSVLVLKHHAMQGLGSFQGNKQYH